MLFIELLDIECALCHVIGVQFDKTICPYKSAILDFRQKLPFAFAQNVLRQANVALINPPFCGDNFLTDTSILCLLFLWPLPSGTNFLKVILYDNSVT